MNEKEKETYPGCIVLILTILKNLIGKLDNVGTEINYYDLFHTIEKYCSNSLGIMEASLSLLGVLIHQVLISH